MTQLEAVAHDCLASETDWALVRGGAGGSHVEVGAVGLGHSCEQRSGNVTSLPG